MKKSRKIIIFAATLISVAAIAAIIALLFFAYGDRSPGWHSYGSTVRYYVEEDGTIAKGYQLIDGQPYYFNWRGHPHGKGWITDSEDSSIRYYCTGGGKLLTGWTYMDRNAWYFYQKQDAGQSRRIGQAARNYTTSGGITIGDEGCIGGEEGEALGYGMDVLNRYGWDLLSAFKYSSSLRYADGREDYYGLRIHSCAWHGFKYGQGNCLAWASTFCVMAKLLGYDCRLVWGTLEFRGEDVTHAWTEIWDDEGIHVYDPRKNGGKDLGGFDRRYGEKGTYKYNLEDITYLDW